MNRDDSMTRRERWATFRFSVIGSLLSQTSEEIDLKASLDELAHTIWKHPISGLPVRFGFSTLERWYYQAKRQQHRPLEALEKRLRSDIGNSRRLNDKQKDYLANQYRKTPSWQYHLFYKNLKALCELEPELMGSAPSYSTVRRYMRAHGLIRIPRSRNRHRPGFQTAMQHRFHKETLSYEASHPGALFHLDFHHAKRQIVLKTGERVTPKGLAILDDNSRLCCHVQWYLNEGAEDLIHGLIQAFLKRGVPSSLMTDNGAAMKSAEFLQGLKRLGISHHPTLDYSPWQNGKQERFWGTTESQLISLLDEVPNITLRDLNEATQVWVEHGYNRGLHSEISSTPHDAFYALKPSIAKRSPSLEELTHAFQRQERRRLRHTDGTVSVEGKRFQIPSQYHTLEKHLIRYAIWDLTNVSLICPLTGKKLCSVLPVDKQRNASGQRPDRYWPLPVEAEDPCDPGLPPLLRQWWQAQNDSGLPLPYMPTDEEKEE